MKIMIMFAIIFLFSFFFMVYMHELSHQEIYRTYGIESKIHFFSEFPDVVTISEPIYKEECPSSCELAHNNADSFFYPFTILYILIGTIGLFVIMMLEEIIDKNANKGR